LQQSLQNGNWQPGAYREFVITEPKVRTIHAAPYIDRVVHHAIINIIEPIWETRFYAHSYACRKGKGTHRAVDMCQQYLRRSKYVLKCDIKKYFPNINHEILKKIIGKKIADKKLLTVINNIIDSSPVFEGIIVSGNSNLGEYLQLPLFSQSYKKKGIPIGNLTSQFFANLYLNELDIWLKDEMKVKDYIRYMDDFIIFDDDKEGLQLLKTKIKEFLTCQLQLELHPNKAEVFPIKIGVPFLGYHIYTTHRRLHRNNIQRFVSRMKKKQKLFGSGEITLDAIRQSVNAWIGHASHGDTLGLRETLFSKLVFVR